MAADGCCRTNDETARCLRTSFREAGRVGARLASAAHIVRRGCDAQLGQVPRRARSSQTSISAGSKRNSRPHLRYGIQFSSTSRRGVGDAEAFGDGRDTHAASGGSRSPAPLNRAGRAADFGSIESRSTPTRPRKHAFGANAGQHFSRGLTHRAHGTRSPARRRSGPNPRTHLGRFPYGAPAGPVPGDLK